MSVTAEQPPNKPNWELARSLYLQGVKNSVISEQCNVTQEALRMRVSRQRWNQDRNTLKAKLSQAGQSPNGIILPSQSLIESSGIVRTRLAGALLLASQGIDGVKAPKSPQARRELAETVKAISDPAKTVFDWEAQKPSTVINLNLLKSARPVEPGQLPAQSIDIQEVKSDTPALTEQSTTHNVSAPQELNPPEQPPQ